MLRSDTVHVIVAHRKSVACSLFVRTSISTSCTNKTVEGIVCIGMRHLSASLSTLWNWRTINHAEHIAHRIVSVSVIHDGVATTIHSEVLQSATLWVVGVEGLSTVAILQVCALLELVIANLAYIIVAVWLVAMNLFKLTTEIVRVSNLLLIRINHLQQTVVAVVSPLRHIGCYRLVRHNHCAAGLGDFAHLAIEVFNGTCSVLA